MRTAIPIRLTSALARYSRSHFDSAKARFPGFSLLRNFVFQLDSYRVLAWFEVRQLEWRGDWKARVRRCGRLSETDSWRAMGQLAILEEPRCDNKRRMRGASGRRVDSEERQKSLRGSESIVSEHHYAILPKSQNVAGQLRSRVI